MLTRQQIAHALVVAKNRECQETVELCAMASQLLDISDIVPGEGDDVARRARRIFDPKTKWMFEGLMDELRRAEAECDAGYKYLHRWQRWGRAISHALGWCPRDVWPDDTKTRKRFVQAIRERNSAIALSEALERDSSATYEPWRKRYEERIADLERQLCATKELILTYADDAMLVKWPLCKKCAAISARSLREIAEKLSAIQGKEK